MAECGYIRREGYMPQDLVQTHVDEWTTKGFADGHEDRLVKRSVVMRDPNDGHVMQTQTTVEKVSKPVMNMYGTSPPALGVPVQVYKDHEYGGSYSPSMEHMMVHRDHNWEGHSPVHQLGQPKSGSANITNWRQRPDSNGHGGNTDNWKHGSDTNTYSGSEGAYGSHPHFEGYHGRNEMERHTLQKPINYSGAAVDNWNEARNSPSVITSPVRYVTESTQSRHIMQPSVIQHETVHSAVNSLEAARRYGGNSIPPQAIKEAQAYTPIINSNEAAIRYNGQIF